MSVKDKSSNFTVRKQNHLVLHFHISLLQQEIYMHTDI